MVSVVSSILFTVVLLVCGLQKCYKIFKTKKYMLIFLVSQLLCQTKLKFSKNALLLWNPWAPLKFRHGYWVPKKGKKGTVTKWLWKWLNVCKADGRQCCLSCCCPSMPTVAHSGKYYCGFPYLFTPFFHCSSILRWDCSCPAKELISQPACGEMWSSDKVLANAIKILKSCIKRKACPFPILVPPSKRLQCGCDDQSWRSHFEPQSRNCHRAVFLLWTVFTWAAMGDLILFKLLLFGSSVTTVSVA